MTDDDALEACPDDLIRRHTSPHEQIQNAKRLATWLLNRGCRPSLADVEAERARRASTSATPHL